MQPRTDLAAESTALLRSDAGRRSGISSRNRVTDGTNILEVELLTDEAAKDVGKPRGRYITLDIGKDCTASDGCEPSPAVRVLASALTALLPKSGGVMVCGLGNRAVTPDALGPLVAERVRVTRHLRRDMPGYFGIFREVSAISTGVAGVTGLDSAELIAGAVERVKPACVLAVDALAGRSAARLFSSVQLCDSGIAPGSGVGNSRAALSADTLGVPVVALGVPTVIDAATLAHDMGGRGADDIAAMFVTSRDADAQIDRLATLIAAAVDMALDT